MEQLVGIVEEASTSSYRPIEYWINRATDPYVEASERKEYQKSLCERVNCELEGAQIATNILSHKVVSPDQDEALYTLQVVDHLVRNCGEKVHVRVGKFRFLNQLVKIITPKYLGNQTSPEVKEFAIRLLYTWQKQILHVGKFKEVYNTLKEHKVILKDPEIEEETITIMPAKSSMRRADFETDETIAKLQKLVQQDNVHEANLYIQSLIEQKEQHEEKEKKRVDDMEKASRLCDELQQLHLEKTAEAIGFAPAENTQGRTEQLEKLLEQLYALRASVQQHVQEAAERNDESLGEMIQINERVNHWIKRSYEKPNADLRRGDRGSEEECTDLLGGDAPQEKETVPPLVPIPRKKSVPKKETQEIPKLPPPPSNSMHEHTDVPFIGFNRIMTPQLPRRVVKSSVVSSEKQTLNDLQNLIDGKLFDPSPPHTFKQNKPTLSQLTSEKPGEKKEFAAVTNGFTGDIAPFQLVDADPIPVLDKMNIRILLYRTTDVSKSNAAFVICVSNANTSPIEKATLTVKSSNADVQLDRTTEFALPGVSLLSGIRSEQRVLHILHQADDKEVEFDISICFTLQYERTITTKVTLPL